MTMIGLEIRIKKAKNKSIEGKEGKVIDETKNSIIIETKKGEKRIIKKQIEEIEIKNGKRK